MSKFESGSMLHSLTTRSSVAFLVFAIVAIGNSFAQNAESVMTEGSTIVIDPVFGGDDLGPVIKGGYLGKAFTLEMGRNIFEKMRASTIPIRLARKDDSFVPYDKLLLRIGGMGVRPRAYVAISVGGPSANCVHVLYPKQTEQGSTANKAKLEDVLRAITEDQYWADSMSLAKAIRDQLKIDSPSTCVTLIGRSSYKAGRSVNLLPPLYVAPVVVIQFGRDLARTLNESGGKNEGASISNSISKGVFDFVRTNGVQAK